MDKMLIAAVSDVHAPLWIRELEEAVNKLEDSPRIILLAGDMIDRGRYEYYRSVTKLLTRLGSEIYAVFGNDEYEDVKDEIIEENPEITFLEDEVVRIEVDGVRIGIVGTKGSLELPTRWQRRNIPGVEELYESRVRLVGEMLRNLDSVDVRILLTHYAPTFVTLKGENPRTWRYLGHRGFELYMREGLVDVAVHGHAHNGRRTAKVGATTIYNVSFPLWWSFVPIEVPLKLRLDLGGE